MLAPLFFPAADCGSAYKTNTSVLVAHGHDALLVRLVAGSGESSALTACANALVASVVQGNGEVLTNNAVAVLFQPGIQNRAVVELVADGAYVLVFQDCVKSSQGSSHL